MKGNDVDSSLIRLRKSTLYIVLAATSVVVVIVAMRVYLLTGASQQNRTESLPVVDSQAPNFTLATLDGTEVSLSQFRGKPVLINFWASWCIPCQEEMPDLVGAYKDHKSVDFVILGVNLTYSDSLPDVQAFIKEFNMTFPVLLDVDGTVAQRLYQIPGIPTSIFISRDGTIARIQVGVMNSEQIDRYVAEILK